MKTTKARTAASRCICAGALWATLLCGAASGQNIAAPQNMQAGRFVATWAAAEQATPPPPATAPAPVAEAGGMTIRQVIRLSTGGTVLRLHLSNAFGTQPLRFADVHLGRPAAGGRSSAVVSGSDVAVRFAGADAVTVPAGAEFVSDPILLTAAPLASLVISLYLPASPAVPTTHPGARATAYLLPGDHAADPDLPGAKTEEHWYQLASLDVAAASPQARALICLGDSITDGHGATTDGNDRWTDVLAERLQTGAATRGVAVLNEGIGGNHLLTDGIGENALGRFDRDVLGPSGGAWLLVFEGINDIGGLARDHGATAAQHVDLTARMIGAYEQLIARGHAHGLKVYGATITPFLGSGYYAPAPADEAVRLAVNRWILAPGHFDAAVDFDAVLRDPANPGHLLPAADSGDHLHPGPAGYRMLGEAVPLAWFH